MFDKVKASLLMGFGGLFVAIPFWVVFGSIYHYTDFFKALGMEWGLLSAYCGACGGAIVGVWWTKESIRDKLHKKTKEEILQEL